MISEKTEGTGEAPDDLVKMTSASKPTFWVVEVNQEDGGLYSPGRRRAV